MRLRPATDLASFLRSVSVCCGDVWFCTTEGDVLNLKSALSRYVFAILAAKPDLISAAAITCDCDADYSALHEFLTE